MKVISREPLGVANVYDIGIDSEEHRFVLANGAVASNCFNKSHSVSYSKLTYITAWLKANHPLEFFCALMTVRSKVLQPKDWRRKAPEYCSEAEQLGIQINPPSVNKSKLDFTIKDGEIYFGFAGIRDVGKKAAKAIVKVRGATPFTDVFDFLTRTRTSKSTIKTFVSLIKAGGFDQLGYNRADLLSKAEACHEYVNALLEFEERKRDARLRGIENAEKDSRKEQINSELRAAKDKKKAKLPLSEEDEWILERNNRLKAIRSFAKEDKDTAEETTINIYGIRGWDEYQESIWLRKKPELSLKEEPIKPELVREQRVALSLAQLMEQAHYIGCYLGAHPAALLRKKIPYAQTIESAWIGEKTTLCAVINSIKEITTRSKKQMAFMEIDDGTDIAEVTIFPRQWNPIKNIISEGDLVIVEGKVEEEEPKAKIILNALYTYLE